MHTLMKKVTPHPLRKWLSAVVASRLSFKNKSETTDALLQLLLVRNQSSIFSVIYQVLASHRKQRGGLQTDTVIVAPFIFTITHREAL